jgi:hypothetical protein
VVYIGNFGGAYSSVTDGAAKDVDHCASSRFITFSRGADLEMMRTQTS